MNKTRRLVIGIVLIELMLGGLWLYLAMYGHSHPDQVAPDMQAVLGQTMGGAMGLILGIGIAVAVIRGMKRPS